MLNITRFDFPFYFVYYFTNVTETIVAEPQEDTLNRHAFRSPESIFRSAPFWSVNDDLRPAEIRRQIRAMVRAGMAGGFFHSRTGLITPYLSERWMRCVAIALDECRKWGVPLYLYDEDRWASGFAGGMLPRPERNAQRLLEVSTNRRGRLSWQEILLPPDPWYNGTRFLDEMDPEAVDDFIAAAYRPYARRFGRHFGATIPAIFTDEPHAFPQYLADRQPDRILLPWSRRFAQRFLDRWGYDIRQHIPSLIFRRGDWQGHRYRYRRLIAELLASSFGKRIFQWCERHGIQLTGHYLNEETLTRQTATVGAMMPLYRYFHVPGVDHLHRHVDGVREEILPMLVSLKQVASVAHQLGKPRVLSELWGGSGYDLSFAERKWIGDFDAVNGITFNCPHLYHYSLAGERKRDWPPTLSHQQPWWPYERALNDYFARLHYALSQGKPLARIVVINPIESVWCLYAPPRSLRADRIDAHFLELLRTLAGEHLDYDLADESILSTDGTVTGNRLAIGRMSYEAVVIPEVITLRASTLALLDQFQASGGTVIVCGAAPRLVEGRPSHAALPVFRRAAFARTPTSAAALLVATLGRTVSVTDRRGRELYAIRCLNRSTKTGSLCFLANTDFRTAYLAQVRLEAPSGAALERWDCVTGRVERVPSIWHRGYLIADLHFSPMESHLLRVTTTPHHSLRSFSTTSLETQTRIARIDSRGWRCVHAEENMLVLDRVDLLTPTDELRDTYVLDAQDYCVNNLRDGTPLRIRYRFRASFRRFPSSIAVLVERPQLYRMTVNGVSVPLSGRRWRDVNWYRVDITKHVRIRGENLIELSTLWRRPKKPGTFVFVRGGIEIESLCVLGAFSVRGTFISVSEGIRGSSFSLTDQSAPWSHDTIRSGWPFYAGTFTFERTIRIPDYAGSLAILLRTPALRSNVAVVLVNGRRAGVLRWPPYELDITRYIRPGCNTLRITIANSLRNLLGPHHYDRIRPPIVGPWHFNDKKHWRDDYGLVPFALPDLEICAVCGRKRRSPAATIPRSSQALRA